MDGIAAVLPHGQPQALVLHRDHLASLRAHDHFPGLELFVDLILVAHWSLLGWRFGLGAAATLRVIPGRVKIAQRAVLSFS